MKSLLLLGATGKSGREVLHYALSKGYRVTALVRDPEKVAINSELLTLIKGSPLDLNDVRSAHDFETVISTLGHSNLEPSSLMTDSMKNVVTIMKEKGIRRIIVQTGAGAGESFARMPESIQRAITDTDLRNVYDDHNGQEQVVRKPEFDWTIVRPVTLTDGEAGNAKILQGSISESASISRKTVAKFLVHCLETNEFIKKSIVISE